MAGDPAKPYGDVAYADSGLQADKKKRYPLDSEEHCRAAWSYINMPRNAAKYSAENLAKVKAKIKAAGRKYGIDFAEDVKAAAPPATQMLDVELARPGPWRTSTGQTEFTAEHLRDAADFFTASGGQAVPIKLGHNDDRFDGEPTFGLVTNVRYREDQRGPVLLGDITGMPGWLAAAAPSRWPNRSVEGWQNFEYDGREYSLILSGLAFLGVTPPSMRNIASLADLQAAVAASSATRVFASALDDQSTPPEPTQAPPDPAVEAVVSPSEEKEAGMDPAKIRERLGLDDDVSDDDVMEALVFAGFVPTPEPATTPAEATPVAAKAETIAASGMIRVDASAWNEREERIKRLEATDAKRRRDERDQVIATAVQQGKFAPSRREHWARVWDFDPEGTRTLIEGLAPNLIPVAASGYAGEGAEHEEDDLDRELARLSDPARKAA